MVDALLKVKKHLKADGLLIDIHPQDAKLPLYVQVGSSTQQVGTIDVESKFAKYRLADEALETVLQTGHFRLQEKTAVDFIVYFDSVAACRRYLAEEWKSAWLPDASWQKMGDLMEVDAQPKQIYYTEGVKFCSLLPLL